MTTMATKTILFPTNLNNKLQNQCFIHIDAAPARGLPESELEKTEIEIRTADNSHPPTRWKLNDLYRLPLCDLTSIMTFQSHALDAFEFQRSFLEKNRSCDTCFPVAIYFYRKILA